MSVLRAPFVRQIASYLAVVLIVVALTLSAMPAKVVVDTRTVTVAARGDEFPPPAIRWAEAFCAHDAAAQIANVEPSAFVDITPEMITRYHLISGPLDCVKTEPLASVALNPAGQDLIVLSFFRLTYGDQSRDYLVVSTDPTTGLVRGFQW